uniref:Ig-like domain-containing protein n=1 Tax=Podarcis muralis TaxID=64176 RepID=A0A670K1Y1_PODMU
MQETGAENDLCTPASLQASPGDRVTIQCKAASSVGRYMALYQFKSGQNPKLLIYGGSTRFEGTPDRFSGSYSGNDFSFTINGVHAEDEGVYCCGQHNTTPLHSDTLQYKNQLSGLRQQEGMAVGVLQQHRPCSLLNERGLEWSMTKGVRTNGSADQPIGRQPGPDCSR